MKRLNKLYFIIVTLIIGLISVMLFACAPHSEGEGGTHIPPPTDPPIVDDDRLTFTVQYYVDEGGRIEGEQTQRIKEGSDAEKVIAIAAEGYEFIGWSDGLTEPERQEKNVTANMHIKAKFEKNVFTLTYVAETGGIIVGEDFQTVKKGSNSRYVAAIAETGYRFVKWSDGITSVQRQEKAVSNDKTIRAIFERIVFTVKYECKQGFMEINTADGKGYAGEYIEFKVNYGDDCEEIVSVSSWNRDMQFCGWTDGIETQSRKECNVTADITVRAKFGYELTYKVDEGTGGDIVGVCRQIVESEESSQAVKAVPKAGYIFSGWSDLNANETHSVLKMEKSLTYAAYFEPIEKTFRYDYGEAFASPLATEVTVNRNLLNGVEFEIPAMPGYTFCGWYADETYQIKVVYENGKLMLGYQTLNLQSDTLYARWQKEGEEKKTYKILMVMVDRIYASLYSYQIHKNVLVDTQMGGIERKLCALVAEKFSMALNKWFEGKVTFEVDSYYTRQTVTKESFHCTRHSDNSATYWLFAQWFDREVFLTELADIVSDYETTITTYHMRDYNYLLHTPMLDGATFMMNASVPMESAFIKGLGLKAIAELTEWDGEDVRSGHTLPHGIAFIATFLHEFCHTIEDRYNYKLGLLPSQSGECYGFHKWVNSFDYAPGEGICGRIKRYLLCLGEAEGKPVGIPPAYWQPYNGNGGDGMT